MELAIDADRLEATMLAGVRLVAFFVIAPPFSYRAFPAMVKVILGIGLAIGVAPGIAAGYTSLDTGAFLLALLTQLVVGLALGFLVYLVFAAVQSAGALVDLFGGFTLAQAYDPQSQVNGAQFTRLFQMASLALLFASAGTSSSSPVSSGPSTRCRSSARTAHPGPSHSAASPRCSSQQRRRCSSLRCRSPGRSSSCCSSPTSASACSPGSRPH